MDTGAGFSLLELFNMGGVFMWPLLFFSVATVGLTVERLIYFLSRNLSIDDIAEKTEDFIKAGDLDGAQAYLLGLTKRRLGGRILLTLINQAKASGPGRISEHRLEKAVESEAMDCINALEDGFNFLTALGSLSPLTGFLGTVSGMIGAFKSIAEATEVNAQIVANGIYEALITTVFGLIIAIIAMVAHSLFSNMVDSFAAEVEKTCSDLIFILADSNSDSVPVPATVTGRDTRSNPKRYYSTDRRGPPQRRRRRP
ncbi:MAG: MotA/TolQ/ExbB proton channel family protein [Treponema sp.]|jgi:biopolymer transport protein ExbB|nr:MotA/TolQ/ExbB proton channel family protein [Treponema sp.]